MQALVSIGFLVIFVGIVLYFVRILINKIPMDETFKLIAQAIAVLVAIYVVAKAILPLFGLHVPF